MLTIAGVCFALLVLAIIITMLLRRQLREKYATLWLVIGVAVLILAVFPGLLFGLSDVLGFEVPSNLLFVLSIVLLVGVALHLSWELSRAEEEIRRLAEESAISRGEAEALSARITRLEGVAGREESDSPKRRS
nr:DUF2304 domain-containing protein [Microbacterium yannicii]